MTGGAQDSGAITRTMEREFWNGVPVVAYHWTIHDPECPIEGLRERPGIAYHWSTGPEDAARLISVSDVEEYLSRATPAPAGWQEPKYLVWSNEHKAWWGPEHRGYTRIISAAGRYDRDEALAIAGTRGGGWVLNKGNPDELAIPEQDAIDQYADITRAQAAPAEGWV